MRAGWVARKPACFRAKTGAMSAEGRDISVNGAILYIAVVL